jgi:outer membrane receptor for ferrienterochelin and colicins
LGGYYLYFVGHFLFRAVLIFAPVKKAFSILAVSICIASLSYAQEDDSLATINLEDVVITGQYEPQSVERSVFLIRTIPMETIKAKGAVRLQDVLNTELNIRFSQDLSLGGSTITMQGLRGQNVKILIDGVPMVGRQGTSNEVDLNQINVSSIERVEIIEGPMSVVYGSDALAGVINIITKKSAEGKLDASLRIHEESVGKEYGLQKGIHNETLGLGYGHGRLNARGDFSRNFFGGYTGDSTGREKMWHPKTQYLASGLVGYAHDRTNVYYRLDYLFEDIFNPGEYGAAGSPPGEALDQNYITHRFMHQVQGAHKFSEKTATDIALAYTDYNRRTRSTTIQESTGDVRLALGAGRQDETKFDGVTVRGTLQYKLSSTIRLQPGVDINYQSGEGGRLKTGMQSIGDYAVFLSAEWNPNSWFQLRPGLRTIYNTVYTAPPVVPSINTKFKLNDRQDIRLSYGRGFRAPSLRELYLDFYDASHAIEGNPGLKAETSHSINGTWQIDVLNTDGRKVTTAVGGFYHDVRDNIDYGQKAGSLVTTYINIERYKTEGITWTNTFRWPGWDIRAGFGYTGRYNQLYESDANLTKFNWSPEATANASYTTSGWTFSVYYKFTGKTPYYEIITDNGLTSVQLAKVDAYSWADASFQKKLPKGFDVSGGVRNLFDVTNLNTSSTQSATAHSGGGIRPVGAGRSYFATLTYTFNQ